VQFFRKGEAAPFEKRSASLQYSLYESEFYFNISQESAQDASGMQEFTSMMQKMSDPKLTPAERDAMMKKLEAMQGQLQANLKQMSDPANIAKRQQAMAEFGCQSMRLGGQGGSLKGYLRCAEKVGTRIEITGVMKFLGR